MRYPIHAHCQFKTDELARRTHCLCEVASEVMFEMAEYCNDRGLPFVVTDSVSTREEDLQLSRVSDEHRTGRAFDISLHGWIEFAILDFIEAFETRFMSLAAISKATNAPRLILRHNNGHGDHIHVQVSRVFAVKNPLKLPEA
jgi:hypothetical protein